MKISTPIFALSLFLTPCAVAAAEAPDPVRIVERGVEAAGGRTAFEKLGIVNLTISEQENPSEGAAKKGEFNAYTDTGEMKNQRLELSGGIVLGRHGDEGWAEIQGKLDTRPQSPTHAKGTINQKLFPLLLPFSLNFPGVRPLAAVESSFEGAPSWRVAVDFPANFFTSPVMNTTWHLEFAKADGRFLCAEMQPPDEFAKEIDEGVRYTPLRYAELDGVKLPKEILMDGVDRAGRANGHTRVTKVKHDIGGDFDRTLFINPARLDQIEEGMIP